MADEIFATAYKLNDFEVSFKFVRVKKRYYLIELAAFKDGKRESHRTYCCDCDKAHAYAEAILPSTDGFDHELAEWLEQGVCCLLPGEPRDLEPSGEKISMMTAEMACDYCVFSVFRDGEVYCLRQDVTLAGVSRAWTLRFESRDALDARLDKISSDFAVDLTRLKNRLDPLAYLDWKLARLEQEG